MRYLKIISWVLGISIFMSGVLKFVDPFKTWYEAQITGSGMGSAAHTLGLLGEILVGVGFILVMLLQSKLTKKVFYGLIIILSAAVVVMMITASYVHIQPGVPAEVLPLKIKAPFIPGFFAVLALINVVQAGKMRR